MNSAQPRNTQSLIVIATLLALAISSAWLGFHSGGKMANAGSNHESSADRSLTQRTPGEEQAPAEDELTALLRRFQQGDTAALDDLLPEGITEISGSGGRGLQRQVRSHGMWFPVFNLAKVANIDQPDITAIQLNKVPLMISTPHPPAGTTGQVLHHRFTAIGGTAPYRWGIQITGEASTAFGVDATSGDFTGMSEEEISLPISIWVQDAKGEQATAESLLNIGTQEPLTLITTELPAAEHISSYQVSLQAKGGTKPYGWNLQTTAQGWSCEAKTGMLTGTDLTPGEHSLQITLTDQTTSLQVVFAMKITSGLEITTDSRLPPAAPGAVYQGLFEATGGVLPYQWSLATGELPPGWQLSSEGALSGTAPQQDSTLRLPLRVTDSLGDSYDKDFTLRVSSGLLVVPSRQRAGLAWRYAAMQQSLAARVSAVSLKRDGKEIYRGRSSNYVDRGLAVGSSPSYTLTAITQSGEYLPYAASITQILPTTIKRSQPGVTASAYADVVTRFNPLSSGGYGVSGLPNNVLGPPDGRSTFTPAYLPQELVSLHASRAGGGSIMLEFTDNIVEQGPGPDLTVFENVLFVGNDPNKRYMEPAIIEVALWDDEWLRLPCRVQNTIEGSVNLRQPAYYSAGFAGVNATTGDDPTNPTRSGGDSFDLATLGRPDITWIRYIRIIATGHLTQRDSAGLPIQHTSENNALSGTNSSGFDLDAVSAVNY